MFEPNQSSKFYEILQDYSEWSSQVLRATFYPEKIMRQEIKPPAGLQTKLEELLNSDSLAQPMIVDTIARQDTLHAHVASMLAQSGKPDLQTFDTFLTLYEDFTERIGRFDIDSLLSDFGVDNTTGLRSANVIIPDLERELERRARRGHPFSIVLCQIDRPVAAKLPEQIKLAAAAMKICMRSFDDAYMSGKNEMLASLKQTDNAGALRFVERLKYILAEKKAEFTMSFCVAEPMPGDDLKDLIAHVRADLKAIATGQGGEAGEYEEISPLQRFVKTITGSKEEK